MKYIIFLLCLSSFNVLAAEGHLNVTATVTLTCIIDGVQQPARSPKECTALKERAAAGDKTGIREPVCDEYNQCSIDY